MPRILNDVTDVDFHEHGAVAMPPRNVAPPVADIDTTSPATQPSRPLSTPAKTRAKRRLRAVAHQQERRIGLQHLAFFRGYLEGLNLVDLADNYLEFGRDARKAAKTCDWIRDAFIAAARKRQDFATARVLTIKPAALAGHSGEEVDTAPEGKPASTPSQSLEEFRAEHDPDEFYTEKELLDLFSARHAARPTGGTSDTGETDRETRKALERQKRRTRLRKRQFRALEELARLLVEDPRSEHHVLGWFDAAVAMRLSDVGITTIGKVVETINALGYRWYRKVPRLGEIGAQRIANWLEHYQDVEGLSIHPGALVHPSAPGATQVVLVAPAPSTGIVPLERFLVPAELNGSQGVNRNLMKNNSGVNDDLSAIHFWLADIENPHTLAKYKIEAERLLLWAILQKQKPMSSLNVEDAREYINVFLVDPQPAEGWVMLRAEARISHAWRPFRGGLSIKSRQDALAALKNFFKQLVDYQYLDHNCFGKIKVFLGTLTDVAGNERRVAAKPRIKIERSLTREAWAFAMGVARALPDSTAGARMRFILNFAYATGLRRAELANGFTDEIRPRYAGADLGTIHVLDVVGKGSKLREIPLTPMTLETLGDYLEARGFPRDPLLCPRGTPLIPALLDKRVINEVRLKSATVEEAEADLSRRQREARPIHPDQLYKAIRRFFETAETEAKRVKSPHAEAFSEASTHWLRHTFVSHALAYGMSLESAKNFAGHESLDTTSIYATAEISRQFLEAEAFQRSAQGR